MKVTVSTKSKKTIDVTLPIYRYHDTGDEHESEHFMKVVEDPTSVTVFKATEYTIYRHRGWSSDEWTYELEVTPFSVHPDEEPDYVLGHGQHALTPERWEEVRNEFQQWAVTHGFIVVQVSP